MKTLDHDGNGEVDFTEFLNMMTSTDLFIAALNPENESEEQLGVKLVKRGLLILQNDVCSVILMKN